MGGLVGNKFWKLRSKDGRPRIFKTPDEMWLKAVEYFEWCEDNPIIINQVSAGEIHAVPKDRPMCLEGLYDHLNISVECFRDYEKRNDFVEVTRAIRNVIFRQQYEGATAGLYNANIVARKLGLAESQNHKIGGDSENPIDGVWKVEVIHK